LSSLTSLNVAGNKLTALPPGFFSSLPLLEELDLSHNALSCLPEGIAGCVHLRVVSMTDNPQLSVLPRTIAQLPNLHELYLRFVLCCVCVCVCVSFSAHSPHIAHAQELLLGPP
jgi:Leucine-rich repeat (LRR) protein